MKCWFSWFRWIEYRCEYTKCSSLTVSEFYLNNQYDSCYIRIRIYRRIPGRFSTMFEKVLQKTPSRVFIPSSLLEEKKTLLNTDTVFPRLFVWMFIKHEMAAFSILHSVRIPHRMFYVLCRRKYWKKSRMEDALRCTAQFGIEKFPVMIPWLRKCPNIHVWTFVESTCVEWFLRDTSYDDNSQSNLLSISRSCDKNYLSAETEIPMQVEIVRNLFLGKASVSEESIKSNNLW